MHIKLNKCSSIFGVWLDEWIHVNAKGSYRFLLLCDTLMQRVHYHDEQRYCNRCRNHELITVIPSYLDQILIRVIVLYGMASLPIVLPNHSDRNRLRQDKSNIMLIFFAISNDPSSKLQETMITIVSYHILSLLSLSVLGEYIETYIHVPDRLNYGNRIETMMLDRNPIVDSNNLSECIGSCLSKRSELERSLIDRFQAKHIVQERIDLHNILSKPKISQTFPLSATYG